jgi:hypothetical protein
MPFYLDQSSLRSIQKLKQPQYSMGQAPSNSMNLIRDRRRSETFKGSRLSLREPLRLVILFRVRKTKTNIHLYLSSQKDVVGNQLASNNEIGNFFPSYDYFTNLNPRIMRRIVNSIALTGRLLRIFDVSFTWIQLYSWISLIEQWPFRMSWLIDMACSHQV